MDDAADDQDKRTSTRSVPEPAAPTASEDRRRTPRRNGAFRSLRIRNYRLWFFGQSISQTGFFTAAIAQVLLVLELTDSGAWLGLTVWLQYAPMLAIGPVAGVICDRVNKRKLLLATQSAMMIFSLVLGVLTLTGRATLPWVLLLAMLSGLAWCVDYPTRNTIVVELVGTEECANAVSLNAAVGHSAKVLGPALGGILAPTVGLGWCFVVNGVSSIAVLGALLAMRASEMRAAPIVTRERGQIKAGFGYAWTHLEFRPALTLLAIISMLSMNWNVLLPLLATRSLGGDAGSYGILMGFMSFGAVSGAMWLAKRPEVSPALLMRCCGLMACAEVALALAPSIVFALPAVVAVGALSVTVVNGVAVLVQVRAVPEMRGRIMAVYAMIAVGLQSFGAPIAGASAEAFGARTGFALGGVAAGCAAFTMYLGARRAARVQAAPEPRFV